MTVANSFSRLKECLPDWWALEENIPDGTTNYDKKLPEGSLFSPEDLSHSLCQARAGYMPVDVAQTEQEPRAIVDACLNKHITSNERIDIGSSGTLSHMELVGMMQELKDLKISKLLPRWPLGPFHLLWYQTHTPLFRFLWVLIRVNQWIIWPTAGWRSPAFSLLQNQTLSSLACY